MMCDCCRFDYDDFDLAPVQPTYGPKTKLEAHIDDWMAGEIMRLVEKQFAFAAQGVTTTELVMVGDTLDVRKPARFIV